MLMGQQRAPILACKGVKVSDYMGKTLSGLQSSSLLVSGTTFTPISLCEIKVPFLSLDQYMQYNICMPTSYRIGFLSINSSPVMRQVEPPNVERVAHLRQWWTQGGGNNQVQGLSGQGGGGELGGEGNRFFLPAFLLFIT